MTSKKTFGICAAGFLAGAVNGLFGAGGGMVLVPLLTSLSGLEEDEIRTMLESDKYSYEIKQDIQEAANLGFDTVPTFLMDRRQAIVGSEPVSLFLVH